MVESSLWRCESLVGKGGCMPGLDENAIQPGNARRLGPPRSVG